MAAKRTFLVNNTLVDDLPRGGVFLRVKAGANRVVLINNLLLGNARMDADRNWEIRIQLCRQAQRVASAPTGDYRLRASSSLVGKAIEPGQLMPRHCGRNGNMCTQSRVSRCRQAR